MIEPEIQNDGIIHIGKYGINLPVVFSIENETFLEYYQTLKHTYDLKIIREDIGSISFMFILFCNELQTLGFDLSELISEFKESQLSDIDSTYHALSLAKVCYGYHKEGYDIRVIPTKSDTKSPDLIIKGITADLKVRKERVDSDALAKKADIDLKPGYIFSIPVNHTEERLEDLIKALDNRAEEAFQQADMLILDMSSGFHTWNYVRVMNLGLSEVPLPPRKGSVVLCIPKNVIDRNNPQFRPKFFWEQFQWDVETRQFKGRFPTF